MSTITVIPSFVTIFGEPNRVRVLSSNVGIDVQLETLTAIVAAMTTCGLTAYVDDILTATGKHLSTKYGHDYLCFVNVSAHSSRFVCLPRFRVASLTLPPLSG